MLNIGNLLLLNANRYPDNIAIVFRDLRLTYCELNERVNRLAHHLLSLGIRKGDRVGFMFYNSNQFVEIWFATQKIGALAVPLNFRMVPREVKWILDNSRCKVFAYSETCAGQLEPVKQDLPFVEHLIFSGKDPVPGEHHFESFTQEGDTREPDVKVDFEDPSIILYTGGTTGFPKGVVHTHRSMFFWQMSGALKAHYEDPGEVNVNQLPLFHNAGLTCLDMNTAIGGKFVIVEAFDPVEILRLIDKERATYVFLLPPAIYLWLLDVPNLQEFDTTSVLRLGGAAGGLSKSLMLRLFEAFPNANLFYGYGLTEGGAGKFHYITRAMVEQDSPRLKSIGQEMPYAEVRLVDHNDREVPLGEVGEAVFRGPSTMKEYFDQPALTAETIKDGWVHTGDLLKKDADGFFYFMDRKKDMIKSGGENVFAQEVEKVIMSHPLVELCAVIGVPDPKFGETVMAVIKPKKDAQVSEEEILALCKKELSSYKKPRRMAFVDALPMNMSGKILKYKLREQYG